MKTVFSTRPMCGSFAGIIPFPLYPSDISPKYDDENLGGGFSGQLLGFGGELVTLLFLYHPKTQRGLYPFRVPTSMRRTRSRFRQSRNRRGGRACLSLWVFCCFRGYI